MAAGMKRDQDQENRHKQQARNIKLENEDCKEDLSILKCSECTKIIHDKYVFRVNSHYWHSSCLKCAICQEALESSETCYIKSGKIFCRKDYYRQFRLKCSCCQRAIQSTDWVRKAKQYVYHLACFACEICKRQLSTGEEFALIDNKLLCKLHYIERLEAPISPPPPTPTSTTASVTTPASVGSPATSSSELSPTSIKDGQLIEGAINTNPASGVPDLCIFSDEEEKLKRKNADKAGGGRHSKRIRTSFTEEQIQILQANFDIDTNPDSSELERIASQTGLSKRVTQVWFQNARARQKKQGLGVRMDMGALSIEVGSAGTP